jgi:hypothetical protein
MAKRRSLEQTDRECDGAGADEAPRVGSAKQDPDPDREERDRVNSLDSCPRRGIRVQSERDARLSETAAKSSETVVLPSLSQSAIRARKEDEWVFDG